MKFLDKKEQVLDIKMTPYGEYLLSQGRFKPEYYSFYDDNKSNKSNSELRKEWEEDEMNKSIDYCE